MRFEDEIKRERLDRQRSLEYYFSKSVDCCNTIESGLTDELKYNGGELGLVSLKGEDIKSKMVQKKDLIIQAIASNISKLQIISSTIQEQPKELEGTLKKYGWSQMWGENGNVSSQEIDKMREYNNIFYCLKTNQEDLNSIRLVVNNIKENKEYKLPIRIATLIGF